MRNSESFIFDCEEKYNELPKLESAKALAIDDLRFELTVATGTDLNEVFKSLSQCGINVKSMRNKSNRLEKLFLDLVSTDE